jgi:YVTN family beta-propeller protein
MWHLDQCQIEIFTLTLILNFKRMRFKNVLAVFALGLTIIACDNDDVNDLAPLIGGDYQSGILVSNEGPFSNGTGTVSFISSDLETVENAIYNQVNNENLGNIVQSIGFTDDKAYVIANNSNAIVVVDRFTFEKEAVIETGLNNPRYFISVNGKGYVTNWGDSGDETDDFVAVINLTTNAVEASIPVDFGPEEIVNLSSTIYVAHQGGFGQNNKISVLDSNTNEVSASITVGDVPKAIQLDAANNLWVLSAGKPSFTGEETAGVLSKINTTTNEVESSLEFTTIEHPNHLGYDGTNLYYTLDGAVYSITTSATALPTEKTFDGVGTYAMTVKDGRLYSTDAKDFASNGSLSIYDLNTKAKVKTIEVGLIPGGVYFN